jgi:cytochrome c oxidase subunit 2
MRMARGSWQRLGIVASLLIVAGLLGGCSAPMSTVDPASDHADNIQGLYKLVFYLAVVVFVGVMAASIVFTIAFRDRPGREAKQIHGNTRLEVIWTLIPVIIVVIIAVPTFDTLFAIAEEPPEDAIEVEVIGHQWWFEFRYPEYDIITANELHLPVGRTASFKLTSADVLHSFWVPQMGGKVDLVTGHENILSFTPTEARPEAYLGQCVEFCGTSHANMRFRVFVHEESDFEAWAQNQAADRTPRTGAAADGETIFLRQACIGCHTVGGTTAGARVGPDLTHVGARTTLAAGIMENTPENMARWIRDSAAIKPGSLMPAFPAATLPDADLQAIVTYLQSLQ